MQTFPKLRRSKSGRSCGRKMTESTNAKQRTHDDRKLGTFGAASIVRVIVKDGKRLDAEN